jgi:methylenetetrahydrofolate dehydrogenase (NADP+) / methenyltetrahydrofolate cyclohydrolase
MVATVLSGRDLAKTMQEELSAQVAEFKAKHGFVPAIAVVRAGEDPASVSYAKAIEKAFAARGLGFSLHARPETLSQAEVVDLVAGLNRDKNIHGIMVQEPLPRGMDEAAVKSVLSPDKDVDGVHPVNAGRLAMVAPVGRPPMVGPFFVPATPAGGLEILKRYGVPIQGKNAVVVGRSNIVGKPMALLLLRENATVTLCHSRTADLAAVCRTADILCAAIGQPRMIKGDWVKPGAAVIDFGVNFVDGAMCGDVDFESVSQVAGMLTPVPGGTGPLTNIMLMTNVLEAARRQVS